MQTKAILKQIGFEEADEATFKWDFGNGKLTAIDGLSFRHGHAMLLSGFTVTRDEACEIDTAVPLSVSRSNRGLRGLRMPAVIVLQPNPLPGSPTA